jgi:hypothetical protein
VVTRIFCKETSVFKQWLEEKPAKQRESIDVDCKLWKLMKFIKDENEVEACKNVIWEH